MNLLKPNVADRLYSVVVITPDFDYIRAFRQPQFESGYDLKKRIDLNFFTFRPLAVSRKLPLF